MKTAITPSTSLGCSAGSRYHGNTERCQSVKLLLLLQKLGSNSHTAIAVLAYKTQFRARLNFASTELGLVDLMKPARN